MKMMLWILLSLPHILLAAESSVVLSIPKMDCPVCPITVKRSLQNVDGVYDVQVSLEDKQATVKFNDVHTSIDDLREATSNAGYPSTVVK